MSNKNMNLSAVLAALQIMRDEVHPRVEAQTVMALAYVATHDDVRINNIQRALELTEGGASRLVDGLTSSKQKSGKPGLGLVTRKEDPNDRRYKVIALSQKGERLAERLSETIRKHTTTQASTNN